MNVNTAYIDVKHKKMCCYCGKEMLKKRNDKHSPIYYQCTCKKAQKEIEVETIIKHITDFFRHELKIDWKSVERNKRKMLKEIEKSRF